MAFEPIAPAARSVRHSSSSTIPSQDLSMQFNKRAQHHMQHHPQHHLNVNGGVRHHPQAVYLSPNPSSAGPQAPPMYYSAPPSGYPHTPNSMIHRDGEEDYDSSSGADGMNEVNPYHRMQMQQPKYQPPPHQSYHSHNPNYNADPAAYYSPSLPTPAVSPASSCGGPNNHPTGQYGPSTNHHSPPSGHASATPSHQPTPYQAPHPPNPSHPQPIHYAAAYNGQRIYMSNEVDQNSQQYVPHVPRLQQHSHQYQSHNIPVGPEGSHGLGISMGPNMKVEVSTPMGTAW
jgi:hypothetical protein